MAKPLKETFFQFFVLGLVSLSAYGEEKTYENLSDLSFEELLNMQVITASKKLEKLDMAPNTMYVITGDEIKRRGYRTLKEVLRIVPGFAVFQKDIYATAQVRGIAPNENEKIAWLVNRYKITSFDPDILNGPIDLSIAERVEIIVGPGSVLYDATSLLATVNIITKKSNGKEVSAALGNITKAATGIFGNQPSEDKFVTATMRVMEKNGWNAWPTPQDHGGANSPNVTDTRNTGKLDPSYFLTVQGQMGEWSVFGSARNQRSPDLKHAVSTPSGEDGDRIERTTTLGIRNQNKISDEFSTGMQFDYIDDRQQRLFTGTDPATNGEDSYDLAQTTLKAEYSVQHKTAKNYFQAALQGRQDQNRSNYTFVWAPHDPSDTNPANNRIQPLVRIKDTYALGAYVSDEYQLLDSLKLVAAARVDKNGMIDFDKTYFSPR